MDDPDSPQSQPHDSNNVLPDVVHSQQIPVLETASVNEPPTINLEQDPEDKPVSESDAKNSNVPPMEFSETESISEQIPSNVEYSLSEGDNTGKSHEYRNLLCVDKEADGTSKSSSLNIPLPPSQTSEDLGEQEVECMRQSALLTLGSNLEDESPIPMPLSSDVSKEGTSHASKSHTLAQSAEASECGESAKDSIRSRFSDSLNEEVSHGSDKTNQSDKGQTPDPSERSISSAEQFIRANIPEESPRGKHNIDSLNEENSNSSDSLIQGLEEEKHSKSSSDNKEDMSKESSGSKQFDSLDDVEGSNGSNKIKNTEENSNSSSDEIIKLDIRGQGVARFPLSTSKIIFGLPPDGTSIMESNIEPLPVFENLLSPLLVGAEQGINIEDVLDEKFIGVKQSPREQTSLTSNKLEQSDLLVEEISIHDAKEKDDDQYDEEHASFKTQTKSLAPEETMSFTTLSTDYKTICEEFQAKLVHLEEAILQRNNVIGELNVSLQRSTEEREQLKSENEHLCNEVQQLQHILAEKSDHDTMKGQLSDFIKYESMIKDDSTRFYSAAMSCGSSAHSSSGEQRDNEGEEITVNYSRSDLKSTDGSDDFQAGFEGKLVTAIGEFDESIDAELKTKLTEKLMQVFIDEVGKLRLDYDTELKEAEDVMRREKQSLSGESGRLRELLATVKAGSADIDALRRELSAKHEKEMENLRTYFERKCSDMERSYSEEVWRGRAAEGSGSSLDAWGEGAGAGAGAGAGDGRRRTRSADLPAHAFETSQPDAALKLMRQKYERRIEELTAALAAAGAGVALYHQDIDLELEKAALGERRLQEVRREVAQQLQDNIQVLLSDPDAELSSWPRELVALRDKIHTDVASRSQQQLELSIRDEIGSGPDSDKWRQRRNHSFDQNRHLEEITRERDGLKVVAESLQRAVRQLVSYCAAAEDELNRTVLAELLARIAAADSTLEAGGAPEAEPAGARRVHFAPELRGVLGGAGLQRQEQLSLDIKDELDLSLVRLRHEAQQLLDLSSRVGKTRQEVKVAESEVQITELVQDTDPKEMSCEGCRLLRQSLEQLMSEAAAGRLAPRDDVVEGYGTAVGIVGTAVGMVGTGAGAAGAGWSPESSPRAAELELLQRERDDLEQQLEAANRQLRSTRQFVEEQAAEREAERDDAAAAAAALRRDNARLAQRLQANARILAEMHCLKQSTCNCRVHDAHVEQLEAQTKDMNQLINELETKKLASDNEVKATEEKITLLRDVIANLEGQLDQKTAHEAKVLEQLEEMKRTIDERDSKMRSLLGELEALRSERVDGSDVSCVHCVRERGDEGDADTADKVKEQALQLEEWIQHRAARLERAHEVCSASCSEPSEDVSLRERGYTGSPPPAPAPAGGALRGVWAALRAHARAEDAALKRIRDLEMTRAQLTAIAQEVRAERDVLQTRMSEQALRVSSLAARLDLQRAGAEAGARSDAARLAVDLHDARAEVQRLREELESKDKQLTRLKQSADEKDKLHERHDSLYGDSCNPKDKVIILERELSSAQSRLAQLEVARVALEADRDSLQQLVGDNQRLLAEKDAQLNQLLALKLDEDQKLDQKSDGEGGKHSARTLSDIVSISEYDEQDLQMRRAEPKLNSTIVPPYPENREKTFLNRTLPPDFNEKRITSLIDYTPEHLDLALYTPKADSLPINLTVGTDSNRRFKRNVNETTAFGTLDRFGDGVKHSTALNIPDNVSLYPNRDVSDEKNVTVEPKKIDFSLDPSQDNRDSEEFTSLRELGITVDVKQENFPHILSQLKREIKRSRSELDNCKSELKQAEEQLCEFPALKEEVEELKTVLENTVATMKNDKKFYENQLENFDSNKKLLEQRLTELNQEVNDKSKDLHLLKEDILRRENMILELAKEKRNLTNKMTELEIKIDELQSRNETLVTCDNENKQLREKLKDLHKLEHLVSEKNQQIDSLNQHLDRLDDLQRSLNDKTEELDNLKEVFEEKSNELFHLQDTLEALNKDMANANEENEKLITNNKDLKQKLTKLEKEQENASLKFQNNESELQRVNSLNAELSAKLEDMKLLTDKLKDKECEIDILNEDINSFHEEIASLKEQLKMASRSPSPRASKSGEEKAKTENRASNDKKQLVKIRKQISLLQHELDFHKKELNDKAFELAKAKLDLTEMKNNINQVTKRVSDKEVNVVELTQENEDLRTEVQQLTAEREKIKEQMTLVMEKMREEGNLDELRRKLREKSEQCQMLEREVEMMKDVVERLRSSPRAVGGAEGAGRAGGRSPTAELERAVRAQLHYSHQLDDTIMHQILSSSSDSEEIPRLALNTSKSSSSIHSSSSERIGRLRSENEKLQLQVNNLDARLRDKDALINELNGIRDKLSQDGQAARLRLEAEREHAGRLQLLLHAHKETADSLQNQDSNMITILKKRLESSMASELELQQELQQLKSRCHRLERELLEAGGGAGAGAAALVDQQRQENERLRGELTAQRARAEAERARAASGSAAAAAAAARRERDARAAAAAAADLRLQLAEAKRLRQETSAELIRSKELLHSKSNAVTELERRLAANNKRGDVTDAVTELEQHKAALGRELAALRAADTRDKDHAVRYLHGRCLRLESCRKALVWQKRYLQRVLAGYVQMEDTMRSPAARPERSVGKKRFKCVALSVVVTLRMAFLTRRRQSLRALAAACLLRPAPAPPAAPPTATPTARDPPPRPAQYSPPSRERGPARAPHELRLNLPPSPQLDDMFRRSTPRLVRQSHEDSFILNTMSPRSEVAATYLDKLELVGRSLAHAAPLDPPRDS